MQRGSLKNCSMSFQIDMCSHLQVFKGKPQSSLSNLTVSFLLPALLLSLVGGNFPRSYQVQSCDVGVFAFFAAKGPKQREHIPALFRLGKLVLFSWTVPGLALLSVLLSGFLICIPLPATKLLYVASTPQGCTDFHCFASNDRTGILIMK